MEAHLVLEIVWVVCLEDVVQVGLTSYQCFYHQFLYIPLQLNRRHAHPLNNLINLLQAPLMRLLLILSIIIISSQAVFPLIGCAAARIRYPIDGRARAAIEVLILDIIFILFIDGVVRQMNK